MIVHRAQKSLNSYVRVPAIEASFTLPENNVLAEESEQPADLAADISFGELVAFQ